MQMNLFENLQLLKENQKYMVDYIDINDNVSTEYVTAKDEEEAAKLVIKKLGKLCCRVITVILLENY